MQPGRPATSNPIRLLPALLLLLPAFLPGPALASPPRLLVVCSPGSPGTTLQAQPTMDAFAAAAARAAGWPEGGLGAAYFETAEAGLARLAQPDAVMALVPPAFLARYGKEMGLMPRLEAVLESGRPEVWSLAAKKGRLSSSAALSGWEVTGAPGFAPDFVRQVLLGKWGTLPADVRITFGTRVLSALRRADAGENVAVLLDGAGAEALPSLPFGQDLEIVTRSRPLPGALLCMVGKRLPAAEAESMVKGLSGLGSQEGGAEVLKSLRLSRFAPLDRSAAEEWLGPPKQGGAGLKP